MFSSAVDDIIESGRHILRSFIMEIRNGFGACYDPPEDYVYVPVIDFEIEVAENIPTIAMLRAELAIKDFEYFDEFDHEYYDPGNPVMLFAEARLKCIIYLETGTGLGGTITGNAGSRNVAGAGTAFLTDFEPGDLIYLNAYPEVRFMVHEVVNDNSLNLYEVLPDDFAGVAYSRVDKESEYIFRGYITDRQITDKTIVIEAHDWLGKLQNSIVDIDEEADRLGPYTTVTLRREPNLNAAGTSYIWEIDPTHGCPGVGCQDWAENPSGLNRVFVPGVFEITDTTGAPFLVPADEYQVIPSLGLIEFKNDMWAHTFTLGEVSVYQEGTLELEDVIIDVLTADSTADWGDCLNLSPGFDDTTWREALTGTFTFVNGSTAVVGVGTAFDTELSAGDRIAHNATPGTFGVVASITNANNLVLQYPYSGAGAGPLAGFKSTVRASFLSLTEIAWEYCDGSVASLLRLLQKNYSDVRGYRIWYDPMDDVIRGDRVVMDDVDAFDTGAIGSLKTDLTVENFYSAIAVTGTLDRVTNLASRGGVGVTALAILAGWNWGFEHSHQTSWGGMTWCNHAGCQLYTVDGDLTTAYGNWKAPLSPTNQSFHEFIKIDLTAVWDIGKIWIYCPPIKNATLPNQQWGVRLEGSVDDISYEPMSVESYQYDIGSNKEKAFEFESAEYRYIKISMRPVKWVQSGDYATMGLREVIIEGSSEICQVVCVQNHTAPGAPPYTEGVGGHYVGGVFITDFYPEIIKKLCNVGHQTLIDDSGLVLSEEEARDRGYLLLDEYIRLYREITWSGAFDPRVQIYRTARSYDTYRETGTDELLYLVESYTINANSTRITGREYGGGALAPNYS